MSIGMYDRDAIEAINIDQIVTATDRLLLLGGVRKARPCARGSSPDLSRARAEEPTVFVRAPAVDYRKVLADAMGAVIALSLTLWIVVTFARLLT